MIDPNDNRYSRLRHNAQRRYIHITASLLVFQLHLVLQAQLMVILSRCVFTETNYTTKGGVETLSSCGHQVTSHFYVVVVACL